MTTKSIQTLTLRERLFNLQATSSRQRKKKLRKWLTHGLAQTATICSADTNQRPTRTTVSLRLWLLIRTIQCTRWETIWLLGSSRLPKWFRQIWEGSMTASLILTLKYWVTWSCPSIWLEDLGNDLSKSTYLKKNQLKTTGKISTYKWVRDNLN